MFRPRSTPAHCRPPTRSFRLSSFGSVGGPACRMSNSGRIIRPISSPGIGVPRRPRREGKEMAHVRQTGRPGKYWVLNNKCIGCICFSPGEFATRGAVGAAGTRNTGQTTLCCLTNAYRGCPEEVQREHSKEQEQERKREGWK